MSGWRGVSVLVTGATGYLGRALTAALLGEGAQVLAAARRPERLPAALAGRVTPVAADLAQPGSFRQAVAQVQVVIHAAVSYGSHTSQQVTNVTGTGALARLAALAEVQRFVHISSLSAYGYRHDAPVYEDSPPTASRDPYVLSKRAGETAVRQAGGSWVILRPGAIYGLDAPLWTVSLFEQARRRPFFFVGDGQTRLPLVHVDDVVAMTLRAAQHPAAAHQAFNLLYPHPPTLAEVLAAYAACSGHAFQWRGLPIAPLMLLAALLSRLAPHPSALAALPELLAYLRRAPTYPMDKAQRLLGWQPQVDLAEGIRRTLPTLRALRLVE